MLVLTRKVGETIVIGKDIEITVVSIKNDQIKMGINAPKNLEVLRKELLQQISNENIQASTVNANILDIIKKR